MSSYKANITWKRNSGEKFIDKKYSRLHEWSFEGGINIPASPSHHIVPVPYSNPDFVDPEEAFCCFAFKLSYVDVFRSLFA
jgi:hypothetical protein